MVGYFCKRLLHKQETLLFTRVNVEALLAILSHSLKMDNKGIFMILEDVSFMCS